MEKIFSRKEILSDNTHANYCEQCKDCTLWGLNGDPFSNAYNKANCAMYPNPDHKPDFVINNEGVCVYKVPGR